MSSSAALKSQESLSPEQIQFFARFVETETGIQYAEANYYQLEHRLRDISVQLGFGDLATLWLEAKRGITGAFRDLLLDTATNNETSFFRDPGIFRLFEELIVPAVAAEQKGSPHIRLWSAASSTGQEAYSLAMLLNNLQATTQQGLTYTMLVSDFSERVLKRAKDGTYSQLEVQRGLPAKMLIQFFDKVGESDWKVKSTLRMGMSFRRLNLIEPLTAEGTFDVIFCRNVLIYQSVENKQQVIRRLAEKLSPKGFLLLGAAESLLGLSEQFEQVQHNGTICYRLKSAK